MNDPERNTFRRIVAGYKRVLELNAQALIDALIEARENGHSRGDGTWYDLAVKALKRAGYDEHGNALRSPYQSGAFFPE